uniref:Reverse transcriptase domain-containing protein n=1 Tax=Tanacetum cinerariifolium TaxID=118510 RepID=A0A6L2LMZ8_TANCI|nr:reverse transcriptase domain-containing protein [Tanacetum cinerariifolium]
MSTNEQTPLSQPTSIVRNTLGKKQDPQDLAKKVHQEKVQQEKLKAVKARLNFEETSQHSESGTPNRRMDLKKGLDLDTFAACPEARNQGATILSHNGKEIRKEKQCSRGWKNVYSTGSETRGRVHPRTRTIQEIDHTTVAAETSKAATRADAKTERWAMPTCCHMFNSTLTGNARVWFDGLSKKCVDSYDNLKEEFLENYLQQKKCIKYPVEIHNINQRDWESIEEFVRRKVSHLIKELKQSSGKDQAKAAKKGETSLKEKSQAILMVQSWQRVAKQNITQTFSSESVISFPPLGEEDGTKGPMIIEAKMEGHFVHRMYVDGGSSSKILYEHCFNRFHPEIAEAKTTFKQMKKSIAKLPMLTAPKEKEELIIYLAAAKEAISAVLMTERDGKQMPIFFSFELEEHDIHYRPKTLVKGHILADFIVECLEYDPYDTAMEDEEALSVSRILFTDGSSCIDGSGAGLIITNPERMEFTYALRRNPTRRKEKSKGCTPQGKEVRHDKWSFVQKVFPQTMVTLCQTATAQNRPFSYLPFSYLGSIVGDNMARQQAWGGIVDRVKKKLSKWKMKMLSIGGRLTLVKSVLGSLPIYNFSIFKVPKLSSLLMVFGELILYARLSATMDHLEKFDEKSDDGFFLSYSSVAKAFRVFNIIKKEIKDIYHIKFYEVDEVITQSNTDDDEINFNKNRSFPHDEFLVPRSKVPISSVTDDYFPYIPTIDPISINNILLPDPNTPIVQVNNSPDESAKFSIDNDHLVYHEPILLSLKPSYSMMFLSVKLNYHQQSFHH